jgi:histidinol dehydrogenase
MGDYYIGTNHILPTAGAGRFAGGLSVDSFKRRRTIVKAEGPFLDRYGDKAVKISRIEGLFAHGEAIKARKGLIE